MKRRIIENSNQFTKSVYYDKRNYEIYQEHLKGLSYQDLALKYNISSSRVGQIIKRAKKLLDVL